MLKAHDITNEDQRGSSLHWCENEDSTDPVAQIDGSLRRTFIEDSFNDLIDFLCYA